MDTEASVIARLRQLLEARSHTVHACRESREAWRWLRELGGVDLLIYEPGGDGGPGVAFLRRLRADAFLSAQPVTAYSHQKARTVIAGALELGVQNYLVKPAKPSQILAEVLRAERTHWRARHFRPIAKVCAEAGLLRDDYPSLLHATLENVIQSEVALRGGTGRRQLDEHLRLLGSVQHRAAQLGFEALETLADQLLQARQLGDAVRLEAGLNQLRLAGKVIEAHQNNLPFSAVWVPRYPNPDEADGRGGEAIIDMVSVLDPVNAKPTGTEHARPVEAASAVALPEPKTPPESDPELAAISQGQAFPVFATVARAIHALLEQDDLDLDQAAGWIAKDAGLTTRVLALANSGYVAPAEPVEDVRLAVQLLGTRRVRVLTASLREGAQLHQHFTAFDWQAFWSHQVGCAILCDDIVEVLNARAIPGIYLAGLLHDVGKILLSQRYPEAYKKALALALKERRPLTEVEQDLFETDHEALGAFYAEDNGLPEPLPSVIRHHGAPERAPEPVQPAVAVVSVANWLCKRYGLGFSGASLREASPTLGTQAGWMIVKAWAQPMFGVERFERQMERRVARARYELHTVARQMTQAARG
ncbi:MAG: HDOD domain-containing protein [Opitutales bacterium]